MKKIILLISFLSFISTIGQTTISVTGVAAGGLSSSITTAGGDLNAVINLTVSGTIDSRDFLAMRDNMPALTSINLGATIVAAYNGNPANAIPEQAFYNANTGVAKTSLTNLIFPATITSIEIWAVSGCRGLTSLVIPNTVTTIGEQAFTSCSGLTSITLSTSLVSIGVSAFAQCRGLTSLNIPPSIHNVDYRAFFNCNSLSSINLENVSAIGEYAFYNCTSLTSITLSTSLVSIESFAFANCSGLTSLNIPSFVATIGSYAFSGCSNLASITANAITPIDLSASPSVFNSVNLQLVF